MSEPPAPPSEPLMDKPAKWCTYCRKDNHNDAECWSTRPKDWKPDERFNALGILNLHGKPIVPTTERLAFNCPKHGAFGYAADGLCPWCKSERPVAEAVASVWMHPKMLQWMTGSAFRQADAYSYQKADDFVALVPASALDELRAELAKVREELRVCTHNLAFEDGYSAVQEEWLEASKSATYAATKRAETAERELETFKQAFGECKLDLERAERELAEARRERAECDAAHRQQDTALNREIEKTAALRAQAERQVNALRGMVGLVQLVSHRYPDFPVDNHRVLEAMSAINEFDAALRSE